MSQASAPLPPADDAPAPRRRRWPYLAPLFFFLALALLFFVRLFAGDASRVPSALIGRQAPALTLPPLEGLLVAGQPAPGVKPEDFRGGQVTVLNVFASWCAPCRVEHPYLVEMARSPAVQAGRIRLVGLNYKDEPENARRFLGALGNPYGAVGVDRNGRASIEWGVYGVPETFLIGPDGTVLTKHIGQLDAASARRLMDQALAAAR